MENPGNTDQPIAAIQAHMILHPSTIKKVFTDCIKDLHQIIVLDGIDIHPDGFAIQSCDICGQLPAIAMKNSGDTFQDKDRLANEVCKIIAIVRLREEMVRFLPSCMLLPPTTLDGNAIVGLQAKPMTWLAEGRGFLDAYHDLHRQVIG
jgi:hypothetical protein